MKTRAEFESWKSEIWQHYTRPEPEQFGYNGKNWPCDTLRDTYHKALNEWVSNQTCTVLHTVKRTDWIPYSIVVETRGVKIGDVVKAYYNDELCTVISVMPDGGVEINDGSHCHIDTLLFQVQATYNFE